MLIARLIADVDRLETRLDEVSAALSAKDIPIAEVAMLESCGDVLQLSLPHGDADALRAILHANFSPSDVLVSEEPIRVPQLLVSDMDSTMIQAECIDELADFAGLKDKISAITERAMRGEIPFEAALRERVALLAGLDEGAIDRCLAERIDPMPGAETLIATLRAKGCRTVLVTGGFHHFADPVAEQIGFERAVGNRLAVSGGVLTGELDGPISDASTKEAALHEEMASLGEAAVSLALGDGANDIPMLQAANFGLAFAAKPIAREAADGWIDRGNLTSVLKLLGIPQSEWVAK
ncbi:phosphoserine phosphatase SerB [Altererythrobacter sp. ZODW24]|uniref:phosphoserine phosphatase SerB n=1 Tax=Altererythrobacter sp. ZODW24 TaxID=2185142 RepID=UPI000DF73848|nr:phosphoserine phosphatase SerB [Altererythrobacter sp. ZODW24]